MLIKIAWRSIWRNRRRTLITVVSIAIGLTFAIFFISLGEGIYERMIDQAVRMQAGHVTIEHPDYRDAPAVDLYIEGFSDMVKQIESWPEVENTKRIILGQGIAKSGSGNVAAGIMGIEPDVERKTSPLARNMVEGEYLTVDDTRKVIIGSVMAERLNLAVGKKLVLSTNDANGDLVEQLFRVKGVFRTGSDEMDGYFLQAPIESIRKLFHLPKGGVTQLGVVLRHADDKNRVVERIKALAKGKNMAVLPWEIVMPDVASYIKVDKGSNFIFQGILIFLILFTIFNTILMSTLERKREFAVLMAIGTKPGLLMRQIFLESVFLGLVGCAAGLVCGGLVSYLAYKYGIDMSSFMGEGINVSGFAISSKLHAKISGGILFGAAGIVFIATLVLSLLPMRKAVRVNLAETLR